MSLHPQALATLSSAEAEALQHALLYPGEDYFRALGRFVDDELGETLTERGALFLVLETRLVDAMADERAAAESL